MKWSDESKGTDYGQRVADQSSTAYGVTLCGPIAACPSLALSIRKKYQDTSLKRTPKPRRLAYASCSNVADSGDEAIVEMQHSRNQGKRF